MFASGVFHSSVPDWGLTCPPIAIAATVDPLPPKPLLDKAKSASSVQLLPFHISVFAPSGPGSPPKNNALVEVVPDAAPCPLGLLYSATSVQDDPFHCSTLVPDAPDIARAASGVPTPAIYALAVLISVPSDHAAPFQSST